MANSNKDFEQWLDTWGIPELKYTFGEQITSVQQLDHIAQQNAGLLRYAPKINI